MTEPLHRCRAGRGCTAHTPSGSAATIKPDTLCHPCCETIQRQRDDLPILKSALRAFIQPPMTSKYGGDSVGGTREPPAPANVSVLDLIDRVIDVLHRVGEYTVRDLVTLPAAEFVVWRDGQVAREFLSGTDLALEIRAIHGKANSVVGLSAEWRTCGAPCPYCRTFTLGGWLGTETVTCVSCGVSTTRGEYEQNNLIQIREN